MACLHALSFDRDSLRLEAPETARVPPYFIWDSRVSAWRTAAINHLRVLEDAAAYRLRLDDSAERFFPPPTLRPALPRLRPDQQAAIEAWERAGRRGVIVKPTGTGKTEIALSIIARHEATTLVVAPLRDLMYQWQRRIRKGLGFEAGVLGDERDTFAGGFMGYLAQQDLTDPASLRRAMVRGATMASFTVEDFSLEWLKRLERQEIEERLLAFADMVRLEG